MAEQKSAADQVKEAVWKYTAQALVLAVVFGFGVFVGYQKWGPGAGDQGQPALAARVQKMDLELNRIKNEREDCKKVLEVTTGRKQNADKQIAELRQKLATLQAAAVSQ